VWTELLPGNRERRTRESARQEIQSLEAMSVEVPQVTFKNIPLRPVGTEGFAAMMVDLNQRQVFEARQLQPKSLAPCAST